MKVIDLLNYLQTLPLDTLNKELTFYDYRTNIAYTTPQKPTVVDESDGHHLDLVFNYSQND